MAELKNYVVPMVTGSIVIGAFIGLAFRQIEAPFGIPPTLFGWLFAAAALFGFWYHGYTLGVKDGEGNIRKLFSERDRQ